MNRTLSFVGALTGAGLIGCAMLTAAPSAAADTWCDAINPDTTDVIAINKAIQMAASIKGWKWDDQDMRDAMDNITTYYPGIVGPDGLAPLTYGTLFDAPGGDYVGDTNNLIAAMNEQLTTVQNADTPSDVLPDAAATLTAATALQSDCS